MSIFGRIMSGIFGRAAGAAPAGETLAEEDHAPLAAAPDSAPDAPGHSHAHAAAPPVQDPVAGGHPPLAAAPDSAPDAHHPARPVDVVAILTELEAKAGQKLNWRQSIVDLMKLLGIDSSLAARKELARELGYAGSTEDSAAMNIWLHRQVMTKLAENGGKVPDELKN